MTGRLRRAALVVFALALAAPVGVARAQIPADATWRTLHTRHFAVHFTPPLEPFARRAAAVAERAYANLASELVPPRGPIDLVISDGADISNGYATTFPRNHIVVFAHPPVDDPSLRGYGDWTALVVQHELTHLFHLDRARGIWRVAQAVFGRNPALFPNEYAPAWLTEGLAVYYESRFAPGGRLGGAYQAQLARAAAIDRALPPLSGLSRVASRFPGGEGVYLYGADVVQALASHGGPGAVRRFVERSSGDVIPYLFDRDARRAFGESFSGAWRRWRDSLRASVATGGTAAHGRAAGARMARIVAATGGANVLAYPRWLGDTAVVFAADPGRETPGAYRVRASGRQAPVRLGRRNSVDANAPAGGALVFAQGDYVDRFRERSDLYRHDAAGTTRLTHAARLSAPDVRRDGWIVAVQTEPGTTRLALVSPDGRTIRALTRAAPDTQWSAPRWSPDGRHIAAVRVAGGLNALFVLDTVGDRRRPVVVWGGPIRSVAWTPDGRALVYTADRAGRTAAYVVRRAGAAGAGPGAPLVTGPGGVFDVDVTRDRAGGIGVAGTTVTGSGFALALWHGALPDSGRGPAAGEVARTPVVPQQVWDVVPDTGRATPYSPWRTLRPAYWSPLLSTGSGRGAMVGAVTTGADVIGRHSYLAQALVNTRNRHVDAALQYEYARFANPVFDVIADQAWDYGGIFDAAGGRVGVLGRRIRSVRLHATVVRPRVRTYASLTAGVELEERSYATEPAALLARIARRYRATHRYPTVVLAGTFANTQRPARSISPEDGIAAAAAVRQRWESGAGSAGRSAVAVLTGYRALPTGGGFAHQVLALRLAGGAADRRTPSEFSVGGVSGTATEIIPGVVVGDPARTFPVRGFPSGSERGIRAVTASAEYRVPLALVGRGLGLLPVFLDRASVSAFADAGRATCPASATVVCPGSAGRAPTLASVGAELDLDTALQYDAPYRLRLGVAHPVAGAAYARVRRVSVYLTLGGSF